MVHRAAFCKMQKLQSPNGYGRMDYGLQRKTKVDNWNLPNVANDHHSSAADTRRGNSHASGHTDPHTTHTHTHTHTRVVDYEPITSDYAPAKPLQAYQARIIGIFRTMFYICFFFWCTDAYYWPTLAVLSFSWFNSNALRSEFSITLYMASLQASKEHSFVDDVASNRNSWRHFWDWFSTPSS